MEARSTSPAETQLARRSAPASNREQPRAWSDADIDALVRKLKEKERNFSAADTTTNHTKYSNWGDAKQPPRASSQPIFSNWNNESQAFSGSRTPSGVGIQNPAWNANNMVKTSVEDKINHCAYDVLKEFTSEIKAKGFTNMDNAACDKMDSVSTLIQLIRSSKTTVTETVMQSSKTKIAQRDYNSSKEFIVVIAEGNEGVMTLNNGFWNRIMSTEYSEAAKREIIEKEIWSALKTAHWFYNQDPGPCQRELADAIMNLASRPAPLVMDSRSEKGFGPGFLFANDKLEIKKVETEIRNQKGATLVTSSDKDKCRVKLGRKPRNPEGTKLLFDATKALCDVLFGKRNVFSGSINACGNEMMRVSNMLLQKHRTEEEWMQKLGNP